MHRRLRRHRIPKQTYNTFNPLFSESFHVASLNILPIEEITSSLGFLEAPRCIGLVAGGGLTWTGGKAYIFGGLPPSHPNLTQLVASRSRFSSTGDFAFTEVCTCSCTGAVYRVWYGFPYTFSVANISTSAKPPTYTSYVVLYGRRLDED